MRSFPFFVFKITRDMNDLEIFMVLLKRVFEKNESGYRLTGKNNRF